MNSIENEKDALSTLAKMLGYGRVLCQTNSIIGNVVCKLIINDKYTVYFRHNKFVVYSACKPHKFKSAKHATTFFKTKRINYGS